MTPRRRRPLPALRLQPLRLRLRPRRLRPAGRERARSDRAGPGSAAPPAGRRRPALHRGRTRRRRAGAASDAPVSPPRPIPAPRRCPMAPTTCPGPRPRRRRPPPGPRLTARPTAIPVSPRRPAPRATRPRSPPSPWPSARSPRRSPPCRSTPSVSCGPPSWTRSAPTTSSSAPPWPRPRPSSCAATRSSIAFPSEQAFQRRMAEHQDHRTTVEDAVRAALGLGRQGVLRAARRRRGGRGLGHRAAERGGPRRAASWTSSTPRRSCPSPTETPTPGAPDAPAEHAADDAAGPEDAAGHGRRAGAAQARAGRGLRRRRHGQGQGQRRPRRQGDRHRPRGDRPRRPRAAAGHGAGGGQRGRCARPRSSPQSKLGGVTGGMDLGSASGCRASSRPVLRAARPAPGHRARQAAGHRQRAPRSASPSTSCAPIAEDAIALADAIREVKERIGLCEVCFNLADGPALPDLPGRAPRRVARSASSRSPATSSRSSARTSSAGRYHVLGGALSPIDGVDPEDLQASPSSCGASRRPPSRRSPRSSSPRTRRRRARRPRCTSPTACASARREVAVTRLASGLPVGADLEYADEVTLGKALMGRRSL